MEANQCDMNCPRKAHAAAELREDLAAADTLLGKLGTLAKTGLKGTGQVALAATCPMRNQPSEGWQPRQECDNAVRTALARRPLDWRRLNHYERRILARYFGEEPPNTPRIEQ